MAVAEDVGLAHPQRDREETRHANLVAGAYSSSYRQPTGRAHATALRAHAANSMFCMWDLFKRHRVDAVPVNTPKATCNPLPG
jgi:hypothetical protein